MYTFFFWSLFRNTGFVPSIYLAEKFGNNFERFVWVLFQLFLLQMVNMWVPADLELE